MSQEKTERNLKIFRDSKDGGGELSIIDLVAKYRLDSAVIWRIIKRELNKQNGQH